MIIKSGGGYAAVHRVAAAVGTMIGMPIFLPVPLISNNRGVLGINMGRLWDEAELSFAVVSTCRTFPAFPTNCYGKKE